MSQGDLFGAAPAPAPSLLPGMRLAMDFLSPAEEAALLAHIEQLPLAPMKYQQYEARRRVVSYGGQYDFSAQQLDEAPPLPPWLDGLRERAAAWIGVAPERSVVFEDALVGIEAAHAGGMRVVGVATTHPKAELAHADFVVERLDELSVDQLGAWFA